jgi:hypothetical protein
VPKRLPKGPLFFLSLLLLLGCRQDAGEMAIPTGPAEAAFGSPTEYLPLADPLSAYMLNEGETRASGIIGEDGGTIELIGHRIHVPAGAVRGPTLFTITAVPGRVEVELRATAEGVLGRVVNVGKRGFAKPVPVTLSYARTAFTNNPPGVDHLAVLRVFSRFGDARYESLPSRVDEDARTVTAELEYFSRYTLASPY